jgi:molecular chaperone GrpE
MKGTMTDSEAKDRKGAPPPAEDVTGADPAPEGGSPPPGALAEPPEEAVTRLEAELDALKDRYLRLAAEYDNFRRRTARERTELTGRAHAELAVRLLDALDDLARFARVDPAATDAKTMHAGIDLVERKLWKALNAAGLVRIDEPGVVFDPAVHEAVTTAAAPAEAQDHTVGEVFQPGYRLGEQLLRPARVLVLTWGTPSPGAGDAAG